MTIPRQDPSESQLAARLTSYPQSGEVVRGPHGIDGVVLSSKLQLSGAIAAVKFENEIGVVFVPCDILTLLIEED